MEENEVKVSKIKKEPTKTKKPKKEKNTNTNWAIVLVIGLLSIALAIGAFFVLLSQEKKVLDSGEKATVYIAKDNIALGTTLTEDMFQPEERLLESVPENAINIDTEELKGKNYVAIALNKNSILTSDMLMAIAETGEKEIGLSTENLACAINGILRSSDYIDIYVIPKNFKANENTYNEDAAVTIDPDTGAIVAPQTAENTLNYSIAPIFSHVYVSKVFNSDGAKIPNSDQESIVSNFNIVLSDIDANYLIGSIQNSSIYIVKCKDRTSGGYVSNIPTNTETAVIPEDTSVAVSSNTIDESIPVDDITPTEEVTDEEETVENTEDFIDELDILD